MEYLPVLEQQWFYEGGFTVLKGQPMSKEVTQHIVRLHNASLITEET